MLRKISAVDGNFFKSSAAVRAAVDDVPRRAVELAALRDDLVARLVAEVPDATLNGVPLDAPAVGGGPARLPGNAHLSFPGCGRFDYPLTVAGMWRYKITHALQKVF